jgi:formyl-CoA transferase
VGEVCDGDLLRARGMVAEMAHTSAGKVRAIKSPVHLSATPLRDYAAPPALGEHTREVLTGLLGYSTSEVDALVQERVV